MRSINITSQNNTELLYVPTVLDYFELMKPRVMSLVVFTTLVGMYLAPIYIHACMHGCMPSKSLRAHHKRFDQNHPG